ncbi:MAG: dehydrogenase [Pirellulaceae bacterium]|nr:MAG: dehydrogenase [Pirellulaceae bacterium]
MQFLAKPMAVLCLTYLYAGVGYALEPLPELRDWPGWRGQDGRGSWVPVSLDQQEFAEKTKIRWRHPVGPGYSGISVAQGRLYTLDRQAERGAERVLCCDTESGKLLWQFEYAADYGDLDYGKGPRSTPLVVGSRVYTIGAVGHVHCFDAQTGRLLWACHAVTHWQGRLPTWGFAASPVLYRSSVIFHIGSPTGTYVAVNPQNGQIIWRAGSDPCGYATPLLVQHGGRDLLVGWTPEHVLGIDPQDGRLLWQIPYPVTYGVSIASPIVEENIVLVSGYWEGTKAIRLGQAPDEARLLWEETRNLRGLMAQPLYRDGLVYLLDRTHGLCCFELATGRILWNDEHRLTPPGRNPHASIVWAGPGQILALNSEGELVLAQVSHDGYREWGRKRIVGPTWAHPAFCGRWVFARDDEQLVCIELPSPDRER